MDERGDYLFERVLPLARGGKVDLENHARGEEVSSRILPSLYLVKCTSGFLVHVLRFVLGELSRALGTSPVRALLVERCAVPS